MFERGPRFWNFTSLSVSRLLEEIFPRTNIHVRNYRNRLAAIAFLHGLAVQELTREELGYHETEYEVTITVRALKVREEL